MGELPTCKQKREKKSTQNRGVQHELRTWPSCTGLHGPTSRCGLQAPTTVDAVAVRTADKIIHGRSGNCHQSIMISSINYVVKDREGSACNVVSSQLLNGMQEMKENRSKLSQCIWQVWAWRCVCVCLCVKDYGSSAGGISLLTFRDSPWLHAVLDVIIGPEWILWLTHEAQLQWKLQIMDTLNCPLQRGVPYSEVKQYTTVLACTHAQFGGCGHCCFSGTIQKAALGEQDNLVFIQGIQRAMWTS